MGSTPAPNLPPDFEQRLMSELRRGSQGRDRYRYRRILLIGYGLVSAVTSAVIMRGQGLDWGLVAAAILGPLALIAALPLAKRRNRSHG